MGLAGVVSSLIALTALRAGAQSNVLIYGDVLGSGWQDWSWGCTTNYNNPNPKHGGTKSIEVKLNANGGLAHWHSNIPVTNYHILECWVHGGTNVGMDLKVFVTLSSGSNEFTTVRLTNYLDGRTLSNVWKQARIPISDFNITSQIFNKINWSEPAGHGWGEIYFDDIWLVNTNTPPGDTNVVNDFNITSRFTTAGSNVAIEFSGQTCAYYQVWASTSLVSGVWSEVGMALGMEAEQVWTNAWTNEMVFYRFSGLLHTESLDYDGDSLSDVYELLHLPLNPFSPFSDADALPDGWEVLYGLSPTNDTGADGDAGDPDGDGRSNLTEYNGGMNPGFQERNAAPLYLDYVPGLWESSGSDGGWTEQTNTAYVMSNHCAMRVGLPSNNALAYLFVRTNYLSTVGFTNLEFWINGGPTGNHKIHIAAKLGTSDWPPGVSILQYTNVQASNWVRVRIPLADIGADNKTNLSWILFKNTNAVAIPQFWVDNMALTKYWPTDVPAITVSATVPVSRAISRRMFGVNVATWDTLLAGNTSTPQLIEGGFRMLRFPGGSAADTYDWERNTNKTAQSWYAVNTSNFLAVADQVGAEKNITINYGSGSANEATGWVHYVFNTLHKTVEWWCVGNEIEGHWEYDTNRLAHSPVQYAIHWTNFAARMKAVNAGIKVGVCGTWDENDFPTYVSNSVNTNLNPSVTNPVTMTTNRGWSAVLCQKLASWGAPPDFWELHYYAGTPVAGRESDYWLLQTVENERQAVRAARKILCDYFGGAAGSNIAIHVTENNCSGYNPGKQTVSLVNGLYVCDMFGQAVMADADSLIWWDLHNGPETNYNNSETLYGWRNYGSYGVLGSGAGITNFGDWNNLPYPAFYGFKLLTNFAQPGDRLVALSNSYPDVLHAYASLSADSNRLSLLVLNTSPDSGLRPTIALEGFTPADTNAEVYSYGISEDTNRADIAVSGFGFNVTNIGYTFPKYSMTVIRF